MQFLTLIALAAGLSLRTESELLNGKALRGPGGKGKGKGKGGGGPPACVADCDPDNVCHPDCDKSDCPPAEAAMIANHCGDQAGEHHGPPSCVADCEPDPGVCHPDCDKSDCDAAEAAIVEGFCGAHANSTNQTVIVDPLDNQMDVNIAHDIHDHVEEMEDCEDADCSPTVVENCKKLWEDKLKVCKEHAEEWAHQCSAPTYNGHNCKRGCCSEVAQDMQDGGGDGLPPPEDMWNYMSGGKDNITREELGAGFSVMLPPCMGPYIENFTDCMMMAYDVSGEGEVTKDEFIGGYGNHFQHCVANSVPADVLAQMANHGDHDDHWEDDPQAEFDFIAGGDDVATVEDVAAAISMDMPPLQPYAIDLAGCIVGQVDTDGSGDVSFDEFEASQDADVMEPCMQHIPEDALAEMAGGQDEHWCTYTDPEEEPCCKLSSHEEQDACYDEKMEDAHYCDFTGPDEEPCCAKSDRGDQEACLKSKGVILGHKKRTFQLLNTHVRASFKRFLRRFVGQRSSKKAGSSKKTPVKTLAKRGGKKSIKLNPKIKNKISSDPKKLRRTAHSK
jgi:hypothetical protein